MIASSSNSMIVRGSWSWNAQPAALQLVPEGLARQPVFPHAPQPHLNGKHTVFGKVIELSGFARSIVTAVIGLVGRERSMLSIVLVCALLTYGGVSLFVVSLIVLSLLRRVYNVVVIDTPSQSGKGQKIARCPTCRNCLPRGSRRCRVPHAAGRSRSSASCAIAARRTS